MHDYKVYKVSSSLPCVAGDGIVHANIRLSRGAGIGGVSLEKYRLHFIPLAAPGPKPRLRPTSRKPPAHLINFGSELGMPSKLDLRVERNSRTPPQVRVIGLS